MNNLDKFENINKNELENTVGGRRHHCYAGIAGGAITGGAALGFAGAIGGGLTGYATFC